MIPMDFVNLVFKWTYLRDYLDLREQPVVKMFRKLVYESIPHL